MTGHPPLGTAPHHPRGTQPPKGMQAKGIVLGPHTHTPAPTARGWRTPTARPVGGQSGEGQRLTSDAPHNGGRHPPRERPSTTPTASNAGPQRRTLWGRCWVPTPAPTAPGTHGLRNPGCPLQRTGGQGRDSARHQTPPTMVESTPPGDALPQPPQRATLACKGARCGAGAGSPCPHRPHPGHAGRGTPAARPRGRMAGGGTAPDTRRASQRWQATPPGDGPPPPRHAAPTGHAGQGDSDGPPRSHAPARSTWVAYPNSPPSGRAVGGGGAPALARPSQRLKAPPPGTPFRHPHCEQRRPARAQALGPLLGPHARTDPTRDTRVAKPRLPAREDGRPGEGQRLTPDAPHNGGRPPPRGTAPHHPCAHSTWVADPNSLPSGRAVGGGGAPDLRRPSQRWKAPPPGTPFRHPAVGPVLGPHARTDRTRNTRVGVPRLPAPEDRWSGEGQRLTPDAPHNGGRPPPPGDGPPPPPRHAAPTGRAGQGDSVGPPRPHARAHSTWVADPNSPPSRPAVGGGGAPDLRRPSPRWKAAPLGTPFRHPHSEQRWPARAHAVGPVLGPDARSDRTRDTQVAGPRPPAPEDGRQGEGQRLTPDPLRNGGRPAPRGRPTATLAARSPHRACGPRGQ